MPQYYRLNDQFMQLAAIAYLNTDPTARRDEPEYSLIVLFSDGQWFHIAAHRHTAEIEAAQLKGWPAWGLWVNDQPAIAWAATREAFTNAWPGPGPVIPAPCRLADSHHRYHTRIAIGNSPYWIIPTRSQAELEKLGRRYPLWQGDRIFVPVDVLSAADSQARAARVAQNHDILQQSLRRERQQHLYGAPAGPADTRLIY